MTPLEKAGKALTDAHSQLRALADRRSILEEQTAAAEALEAKLLRGGSDLSALADARNRASAGRDLVRQTAAEAEALEGALAELEAAVDRETVLELLAAAGAEGAAAERDVGALRAEIAGLIAEPITRLIDAYARQRAARGRYNTAGRQLSPFWDSPDQRPAIRDQVEGLLRRRGSSLRAVTSDKPTPPKDADAAATAVYRISAGVINDLWVAEGLAAEARKREAALERERARAEAEAGRELAELTFPRSAETILEALPAHVSDRRSHRGPDGEMMLTVRLERRHLTKTLAGLKHDLSPANYAQITVDDDGGRPTPTPLAPPSDLKKSRVLTRPDPRALR